MGFDDRAAEDFVGADATVVATLWGWKTIVGPAEGLDAVEEGVLLLQAEPRVVGFVALADLTARGACVGWVRLAADQEHFAHDQLVRLAANRVIAHEDWLEHTVGTIASSLLGARPVETPDRWFVACGHNFALR